MHVFELSRSTFTNLRTSWYYRWPQTECCHFAHYCLFFVYTLQGFTTVSQVCVHTRIWTCYLWDVQAVDREPSARCPSYFLTVPNLYSYVVSYSEGSFYDGWRIQNLIWMQVSICFTIPNVVFDYITVGVIYRTYSFLFIITVFFYGKRI